MGFFANSIRRTVFDKQSYAAAVNATDGNGPNGYAVIKITPRERTMSKITDLAVVGIIQTGLSFSVDAIWSEFGSLSELAPDVPIIKDILGFADTATGFLNTGAARAGIAEIGSVYKSKKFYRKSGDIRISPVLKIVDWNGNGQPLLCSKIIAALLLPGKIDKEKLLADINSVAGSISSVAQKGFNALKKGMDAVSNATPEQLTNLAKPVINDVTEGVQAAGGAVAGAAAKVAANVDDATDKLGSNLKTAGSDIMGGAADIAVATGKTLWEGADDLVTLRSSPTPVIVEIGSYFLHNDMVITNATFNFSKECTKNGPLYVDITLDLSSRTILSTIDDVGFRFAEGFDESNVSFTGGI